MAETSKSTTPESPEETGTSDSISEKTLAEWEQEAEDGSVSHQIKLGSHYLKLADGGLDREDNGCKAVSWFIKASQRGDEEATDKLRHCVSTELGVTDKNKADVVWCINTPSAEKRVRYAAKSLFTRLGAGQKGVLSKDEYTEAINSLTAGHEKERKILLAAGRKIGDTITESEFVKTISKKIQGTLTLTADEADETSAAYNAASPARKILAYPTQTAKILLNHSLEFASSEGLNVLMSFIPYNQIYLLAMVFAYGYLKAELFLLVIPLMSFFISFSVMVIATLQMFYKKRKQKDASSLVSLLQSKFDADIDVNSTESQYSWNSLTPYYVFFSALPITVIMFSIANKAYIPCAEMLVISFGMTVTCFFGLSDSHDMLTLVSLACHAFSALPMVLAKSQSVSLIAKVVGFISRPLFSLYLGLGVSFNLSLPSIVHMFIPFLFLRMALRGGGSGVLKTLVPHLVCYCWFSFATAVFPSTTWLSLARATVGYLLLPIFVPVGLVAGIFAFFFVIYKLLQTEIVGKLLVTALLISVPIILTQTKTLFGKNKKKPESKRAAKIQQGVMIGFAIAAIIPLLFVRVPTISSGKTLELNLDDYRQLCVAAEGETDAPYQMRCQDFVGAKVNWTGSVTQVKVTKVENSPESVIKSLPSLLAHPLYCTYGEALPACDPEVMSEKALRHCQLVSESGRTCHLHGHDQVSFSLVLSVADGALMATLEASNKFKARLLALEPKDEVQFSGTLLDVGTSSPKLKLRSLVCTSRQLPIMEEVLEDEVVDEELLFTMASDALSMTFNFGLFPVLTFTPEF